VRELLNDGPEVAEACDHCTHPWAEHHSTAGCTRGWVDRPRFFLLLEGASLGCLCRLAHTGVLSA
jgi:hypothetical protein